MTAPQVTIDVGSATPPYEQIRTQLAGLVASGELTAGARLPTVRALAADLGIAANTVARAYKELEQAGTIVTRRRAGTTVAVGLTAPSAEVSRRAGEFAQLAVATGMDETTALDLVRNALRVAQA